MNRLLLDNDIIHRFHEDGFFLAPGLLDQEEVRLLRAVAGREQQEQAASRCDGQGRAVKLTVTNDLQDDIFAAVVRCAPIVEAMELLLGGEVYHYHHKLIMKEPLTGGAWEWHQDYGYWYNNGCLFPLLASSMIAMDPACQENGCMQVLKGSHLLGRIDHGKVGDQVGADMERVAEALRRLELVHCELDAGSAIFFHCNLLHCSGPNLSPDPRWAFISCYNAARNNPYKESRHPRYSRLEKWPPERIKEVGRRALSLPVG